MSGQKVEPHSYKAMSRTAFFWRPRGFVRSLAEVSASSVTDVKSKLVPPPQDAHPLVVAELPGGKVIGDTLLVATADDVVIGGLQGLNMCEDQENNWLLRRRRFRFPRRIRGTALMLSMNGDNYFHWCLESLPRWKLLLEAGWNAARADWVVLSHNAPAFQEEMLKKLGVPPEKWLRCWKWEVLQFDRLITPSMPVPPEMLIHRWLCDFLRQTFLPADIPREPKKIYVSRRGSPRRRITNELEIEQQLTRRGFHVCAPETMTVEQQAKLFAAAELIVAPHGAGLSNLVFCTEGSRLVELMHGDILRNCYERLAKTRGMEYRLVVGKRPSAEVYTDDREAEFTVDLPGLMQAIEDRAPT